VAAAGARASDIVLMMDADELARRDVVATIAKCQGIGLPAGTYTPTPKFVIQIHGRLLASRPALFFCVRLFWAAENTLLAVLMWL
jgi:hypothetical protein